MHMPAYQQMRERIRAEYLEMPGLSLTAAQVQRLCGVERELCRQALDALVDEGVLRLRVAGAYTRLTAGDIPRPRPARATLVDARAASIVRTA